MCASKEYFGLISFNSRQTRCASATSPR
jgi:hypothetical protein